MNAQNYTQKSLEAIQAAQKLTIENQNQQIEQIHLLAALLKQENGLVPQLLKKMGVTLESFEAAVDAELAKLPRVTGSGREADKYYVARAVDTALNSAEDIAKQMKDEYVSVEHLFLSLIENADAVLKSLFRPYQITKEACLQALQSVRGSQRVTSDTPEDTYEALAKYGTDLVKRAREQKMDPVIGRDECHPHPVPQDEEQPRSHRRTGRRQDGHRRGPCAADRRERGAQVFAGQNDLLARYGRIDCRREVPR